MFKIFKDFRTDMRMYQRIYAQLGLMIPTPGVNRGLCVGFRAFHNLVILHTSCKACKNACTHVITDTHIWLWIDP